MKKRIQLTREINISAYGGLIFPADINQDGFHEFLAGIHDEFVDGIRDPEKQQNIMRFILRFRVFSQKWEEMAAQGDDIHRFCV